MPRHSRGKMICCWWDEQNYAVRRCLLWGERSKTRITFRRVSWGTLARFHLSIKLTVLRETPAASASSPTENPRATRLSRRPPGTKTKSFLGDKPHLLSAYTLLLTAPFVNNTTRVLASRFGVLRWVWHCYTPSLESNKFLQHRYPDR